MIKRFAFWFCAPWVLFIVTATFATGIHKPGVIPMLVLLVVLIGFAARSEYIKAKGQADARLAAARKMTPERRAEAGSHKAGRAGPAPFNPRSPGQFTSFAFRYGLPPGVLQHRTLPPAPLALPPPADDS